MQRIQGTQSVGMTMLSLHDEALDRNACLRFGPIEPKKSALGAGCDIFGGRVILPGVRIGECYISGAGAAALDDLPPVTYGTG